MAKLAPKDLNWQMKKLRNGNGGEVRPYLRCIGSYVYKAWASLRAAQEFSFQPIKPINWDLVFGLRPPPILIAANSC